jgi:E3 ubiquitin-protein ligase EDD1
MKICFSILFKQLADKSLNNNSFLVHQRLVCFNNKHENLVNKLQMHRHRPHQHLLEQRNYNIRIRHRTQTRRLIKMSLAIYLIIILNRHNSVRLDSVVNNILWNSTFFFSLGRRALELILADWSGVKSMLLCGCPDGIDPTSINLKEVPPNVSMNPPILSTYDNEQIFSLDQQQQTSQLDRFTYFLLAKCHAIKQTNTTGTRSNLTTSNDLLDILLATLTREIANPTHRDMARFVTARFVRSVIRLFIILNLESIPDKSSSTSSPSISASTTIKRISATTVTGATITSSSNLSSSNTLNGPQAILYQCKRIFQTLTIISIDALVHMADLLLAPVRHGIAKPTAMFTLLSNHTDILQGLEEVFNIDSEYYRAYQENRSVNIQRSSDNLEAGDISETDPDDNPSTMNPLIHHPIHMELNDDDDNNSDSQSQHEQAINPVHGSSLNERTTTQESTTGLSDNESEMELELLAESDTDNESNRSAPNTNTHRTSATAGSENMALFSDDENSESDDADSVRSDSVLGEGDETSQPEPMLFEDTRDTLVAATGSSTSTTVPTGVNSDRLVLLPSGSTTSGSNSQTINTSSSHLNVPRLNARTTMASKLI